MSYCDELCCQLYKEAASFRVFCPSLPWAHHTSHLPQRERITAYKVESENKEAWDKVRTRSAVTTESVKGATELGNQIAKLMAALTRAGHSNSSGSAPNSPRQQSRGRWWIDQITPGCPNSYNGWTGLGQTTSTGSASVGHGTGTTTTGGQGWNAQGSKDGQGGTLNKKDPSSLLCCRCQGLGQMAQE